MRTRLPLVRIIRSAQKFAVIASSLVLLAERSATAQTTNLSSSGAVRPGMPNLWQLGRSTTIRDKTSFASADIGKDVLKQQTRASLADSGPHHRLWTVTSTNTMDAATSRLNAQSHRVMEIGSGMNYWDGEKWTASDPTLEVSPDGDAFVANRLCYKLRLQADNLNTPAAITITTPDGKVLKSTPIAIGLYDAASGQTMILAGITNCTGVLVSSNKVVYEDAFNENGVRASVVCTAERGSFAADIVLTSRLDPTDYGFPTNTTRIQMITEYYDPPEPERIRTAIRVETDPAVRQTMASPDLIDETLGFGELAFGQGLAYTMTNDTADASLGVGGASVPASQSSAVVAKEFITVEGRTFLVESVEYPSVQSALQSLPQTKPKGASLKPKHSRKAEYASIRPVGGGQTGRLAGTLAPPVRKRSRSEIASITPVRLTGVCIDPIEYIDSGTISTAKVFQGDTTYFISGPVYCSGPVTIEGGAVFKYPNSTGPDPITAFLQFNNTVTCKTSQYRPAIFTAGDDDTIGEKMDPFTFPPHSGDPTGKYYANPAIVTGQSLTLSNCRFRYAKVGIACSGSSSISLTVEHSQFVSCIQGISVVSVGSGSGSGTWAVQLNNCLMAEVNYCFDFSASAGRTLSVGLTHCTIAGASALKGPTIQSSPVSITSKNSIFANVSSLSVDSYVTIGGDYNGFYSSSLPSFGTHNPGPPGSSPFQSSDGGGNCYLKNDSSFRGVGTTAIASSLLNSLKTRSTQPPVSIQHGTEVTSQLTLSPQDSGVPRYTTGPPDLGYWYAALDYSVANVFDESGGAITVQPGTAIAVRTQDLGEDPDNPGLHAIAYVGFVLEENATFVSHGTPNAPITLTTTRLIQEGPSLPGWNDNVIFLSDFEGGNYIDKSPNLSMRFCNTYLTSPDKFLESGGFAHSRDQNIGANSCMFLSVQDSLISGGQIDVEPPYFTYFYGPPSSMSWVNNVFERVFTRLKPSKFRVLQNPTVSVVNMDMPLFFYNNLMLGCYLACNPSPSSAGSWVFKDNLFDQTLFTFVATPLSDHDHNAYWLVPDAQVPDGWYNRLYIDNDDGSIDGVNDKVLTSAPTYQTGPFGNRYLNLTSGSLMYQSGSRSRGEAGLSHYTTQLAQTEDSASTTVNIGPHYVVAVNGSPKSALVSGVPDYVADADGNGIVDATEAPAVPPPITPVTKANNDFFHVEKNSTGNVLPVLVNDTDSQGLPLTIWYPTGTVATAHGTVSPSDDHLSLVYTPTPGSDYYGPDTFTYAIVNDFNHVSSATNTVFINNTANHQPVAANYPTSLSLGATSVSIEVTDLLSFCSDPDCDPNCSGQLSLYSIGNPQLPTARWELHQTLVPPHLTLVYFRDAAVAGTDTFTYTITDGNGGVAIGTIQVGRDTGVNHPPVALSYSTTIWESPFPFKLVASDQDNNTLTYSILQQPHHGGLTGTPPDLTYTPASGYRGADHIVFKANDGTLDSAPATVTISVEDSLSSPEAFPQSVLVVKNTATPIPLGGWDPDNDTLWFHVDYDPNYPTQAPAHGTLSGTPPSLTYTPDNNYIGPDSFTFWVSDGILYSGVPATVSINVIPPLPTGLVAVNDIFQVQQGSLSTDPGNILHILANDMDYQGYPVTIDPPSPSTTPHGTLALAANSTRLTYAPSDPNFFGSDSFNYVARDDHSRSASGSVTVFVNKTGNNNPSAGLYDTNLAPTQVAFAVNIGDLLNNYCFDPDAGDTVSLHSITQPSMGTAVNNGSGLIIYTRSAGKYGTDSFRYTITDGKGGCSTSEVTVQQADTDGDGIPDDWEVAHGLDPNSADDAQNDPNGNGLTELGEYLLRNDPAVAFNPLDLSGVQLASAVSGTVDIPLYINPRLDSLGPDPLPFSLVVDGHAARARVVKTNGVWTAQWDTQSTPNGPHALWLSLACINMSDLTWSEYPVYGYGRMVTVSNAITISDLSRRYTDLLVFDAKVNLPTSDYRIEVYDDATGAHLNTLSGIAPNRRVLASWDLRDTGGNRTSANSLRCEFFLTSPQQAPNQSAAPAAVTRPGFVQHIQGRSFTVAYGYNYPWLSMMDKLQEMMLNAAVDNLNTLNNGHGPGTDYNLLPTGADANDPWGHAFQWFCMDTNSGARLFTALKDTSSGNFYWWGHGYSDNISPGRIGRGRPIGISVWEVMWGLQNDYLGSQHPYRLAILDACLTYSWDWATAFGVEYSEQETTAKAADYVSQTKDPQAFVGWVVQQPAPADEQQIGDWEEAMAFFWDAWQRGLPLDECLTIYTDSLVQHGFTQDGWHGIIGANGIPDAKEFRISGCKDLTNRYR